MAISRILPGVASLNGCIYVVGGEQESKILANGEFYDPLEDKWCDIASMVIPRWEIQENIIKNINRSFEYLTH